MIQQCPLCQISIGRPANFCRKCGARLSDNSSAARSVELTHHPASSTRAAGSSTSPAKQTRPLSISSTSTHYASSTSRQGSTGRDIRITPRSRQSTAAGLTVIKLLLGLLTIAIILTIVVIIFVKLSPPEQPQEDANPSSRSGSREPFDQPARRVQRLTSRQIEQLRQRALDSLGPARGERTSKQLISSLGRLVYPGATPELSFSRGENSLLMMRSNDLMSEIESYYQGIFDSNPVLLDSENQQVFYSNHTDITTLVTIAPDESTPDHFRISIIRSRLDQDSIESRR